MKEPIRKKREFILKVPWGRKLRIMNVKNYTNLRHNDTAWINQAVLVNNLDLLIQGKLLRDWNKSRKTPQP